MSITAAGWINPANNNDFTGQINSAISAIPAPVTLSGANSQLITSENDLPSPDAQGRITLQSETDYVVEGKVTINNILVIGGPGIRIRGAGSDNELFFDEVGAQKNLFIECLSQDLVLDDLTFRGGGGNFVSGAPGFQITIPFLNFGNITQDPITDPLATNGRNKNITVRGCKFTQQKELGTIAGFRSVKFINNTFIGSDNPTSTLRTLGPLRISQCKIGEFFGNRFEEWDSSATLDRVMMYVAGPQDGAAINFIHIRDNVFEAEDNDIPLVISPDVRIDRGIITGNNFKLGTAATPAINYYKYELGTNGHVSVRDIAIYGNQGIQDMKTSLTSVLERNVGEFQATGNTWTAVDITNNSQTKFLPSNDFGMLLRVPAGGTGTIFPATVPFLQGGNVLTSTTTGQNLTIMEDAVTNASPAPDLFNVWVHDLSLGSEWAGGDIKEFEPDNTPTGYETTIYELAPTFKYLGKENVNVLAVACATLRFTGAENKDVRCYMRLALKRGTLAWAGVGTSVSRVCEQEEESDNLTLVTSVALQPGDQLRVETRTNFTTESVAVEYLNFNISV
jgi:hypothetical protein